MADFLLDEPGFDLPHVYSHSSVLIFEFRHKAKSGRAID